MSIVFRVSTKKIYERRLSGIIELSCLQPAMAKRAFQLKSILKREMQSINKNQYGQKLYDCCQQGICFVNHLMTLKGALMRLKAMFAIPAQQMKQGQQHPRIVAITHITMPSSDSTAATNINGRPMRNPRGRQSSHILTPPSTRLKFKFSNSRFPNRSRSK